MYSWQAWAGVALCIIAGLLFIASGILWIFRKDARVPFDWEPPLIVGAILLVIALLWGNIGVIVSNAGFSG